MEHVNAGLDAPSYPLVESHASIKAQSTQYTLGDFLKEAETSSQSAWGLLCSPTSWF
jgi:hypothetical protein